MPRLPRSAFPTHGIWHVTTRGVDRRAVFLDAEDARGFLVRLARAVEREALRVIALCLMPNHYHLLVADTRRAGGSGWASGRGR